MQKLLTRKPLFFTAHAQFKMRQYGLSPARVKRVLLYPARIEEGIAPKTVAVMAPARTSAPARTRSDEFQSGKSQKFGSGKPASWSQELWVMYQDTKAARKIIAAWRYPGVSPVRQRPPFPEDILG